MSEEKDGILANLIESVVGLLAFIVVLPIVFWVLLVAVNLDLLLLILAPVLIGVIVIGGIVKAGYILHRMDDKDEDGPDGNEYSRGERMSLAENNRAIEIIRMSVKSNERLFELLKRAPSEDRLELYKRYGINHISDLALLGPEGSILNLVAAIRKSGSNSIATVFRGGEGINYGGIVLNVAKKFKVDWNSAEVKDERDLELLILQQVFKDYFDKLAPEEKEKMKEQIEKLGVDFSDFQNLFLIAGARTLLAGLSSRIGGKVLYTILSTILRQIVARQAAGQLAYRTVGLFFAAVPVLNVLLGAWLVLDIAGPANRKTVPTVVEVAMLRLQFSDS